MLRGAQTCRRDRQERFKRTLRKRVACNNEVVFSSEDEHTPLGIREGGDVFSYLVTYLAPIARSLLALLTFEHRLAVEMLPLLSVQDAITGGKNSCYLLVTGRPISD